MLFTGETRTRSRSPSCSPPARTAAACASSPAGSTATSNSGWSRRTARWPARTDGTRDRIFAIGNGGASRALPLGDVDVFGAATAAHDGTLAFVGATPVHPAELYVLAPGAPGPRRLTHVNDPVAAHAIGRTRTIAWRSADGFTPTAC